MNARSARRISWLVIGAAAVMLGTELVLAIATVYFCALEALNNVAKYADATSATVRVADGTGELRFEVTDDGRGFDPATTGYGTGLQGMADRLAAIGGSLEVRSAPGAGTTLFGAIPVPVNGSRSA